MFGGGHAATIAVRATKKGFLKPKAIAAVAPTWAGPLPIVFGKDSNMESRYGLNHTPFDTLDNLYVLMQQLFILIMIWSNIAYIGS